MEADTALQIVHSLHGDSKGDVYIHSIVADDDSTMRSLLKYKSEEHKKGQLKEGVPEPEWLADPTHRTKCVAKPIYGLASANKATSLVTKLDAMQLKKYYSYFVKQSRNLPFEEMKRRSLAPLEHLFNDHRYCHSSWCIHKKREEDREKDELEKRQKEKEQENNTVTSTSNDPSETTTDSSATTTVAGSATTSSATTPAPANATTLSATTPAPANATTLNNSSSTTTTAAANATTLLANTTAAADATTSNDSLSATTTADPTPHTPPALPSNSQDVDEKEASSKSSLSENNNELETTSALSDRDKERMQAGYYRDKNKPEDMKVYKQIKSEYEKFVTEERLKECYHNFDTQLNESLNNAIAKVAPKNRTYCKSLSLSARVHIVIGIQNYGYKKYWNTLVTKKLGIEMSESFRNFLQKREKDLNRHKSYQKELRVKRMRIENYLKKMNAEIAKQLKDKQRGATYEGRGGGLANVMKKKVEGLTDDKIIQAVQNGTLLTNKKNTIPKITPFYVKHIGKKGKKKRGEMIDDIINHVTSRNMHVGVSATTATATDHVDEETGANDDNGTSIANINDDGNISGGDEKISNTQSQE